MSTVELKSQIIERLNAIEDEVVLEEIYNFLKIESDVHEVYKLSENEVKAVKAGLKDVDQGKLHSTEKSSQLIREWLKK